MMYAWQIGAWTNTAWKTGAWGTVPVVVPEAVVVPHPGGGDISRTHVVVMDRDNYGADDEIAAALWEMLNG